LTKRGINVILVGRNLAHLRAKEKDLHKVNSEVQTKIIKFDFAQDTSIPDYQTKIYDKTSDLEVSFLVNNAGLAVAGLREPSCDPAIEVVAGDRQAIAALTMNILAQTNLLHNFIPIFNKRAKSSPVIDLSGQEVLVGSVYQPVYGATKAFNYTSTVAEG
jgi:short-subunit dehydrogenase